jgi:hypothetical protein
MRMLPNTVMAGNFVRRSGSASLERTPLAMRPISLATMETQTAEWTPNRTQGVEGLGSHVVSAPRLIDSSVRLRISRSSICKCPLI